APQVLSAVRVSGPPAGVLVSWLTPDNGGSPITGYNVYRGTSSGSETLLASVSGVDTNKYLDQTANSATNYYYRTTALNTINNAQTAFVALDTVPPHSTALPGVVMGRHDPRTGGGTIDTTLCGAPSQTACPNLTATASRDGTITYKLNTGSVIHFNAPSAAGIGVAFDWDPRNVGTTLTSTAGNTWIFVGAAGTGALELAQTTTGNPYTRIGNVSG